MGCNCGNKLTPKWLDKVMDSVFSNACYEHDRNYYHKRGKLKSDVKFLAHMIKILLQLVVRLIIGLVMFIPMFLSVLVFGFTSYNIERKDGK